MPCEKYVLVEPNNDEIVNNFALTSDNFLKIKHLF